ncbi:MAG: glutamate racemase [Syntrophobacterales bacterium CG_4_8_14_3_um_filter_58_8]|nr:MAG: glutamate racemase [Syntrophobacterales bacterium CG03_land_8_20_14_0_80_58_14]PJC73572.1 MAG: glutamate racemase [Syntrophobacterales bacterium CG_4_8_14_3_um_filter_58_8]
MNASFPIGIFDSGVGGLSVLREIRTAFASEDLLYVADSACVPYGDKSPQFVEARSVAIAEFLVDRKAKAIVVACNTATGAAITTLRSRFSVPIVGIEPAVKPAMGKTASGVVAVLATSGTLSSDKFAKLLARFGGDVDILIQPCAGLVEQVEAGELDGEKARALTAKYLLPLLERGADTIILGCTHYPFLAPLIREIAGPKVSIVDPNAAIAHELRRRLENNDLLSPDPRPGTERFWTSGAPDAVKPVISKLWNADVDVRRLPKRYCRLFGL